MTRLRMELVVGLLLLGAADHPVAAQQWRPAIVATVGAANLYRPEDRSFGTGLDAGGGVGADWKRLGVEVAIHRTLGLSPHTVRCGVVSVPCAGSAREGVREATMLTANVSYLFGRRRVRPFVTGSIGALWIASLNSLTTVGGAGAELSEFHQRDAGLAIGVGGGVDLPLTRAWSLRPEFRTYTSSAMSDLNLGVHRGAIALRYRW